MSQIIPSISSLNLEADKPNISLPIVEETIVSDNLYSYEAPAPTEVFRKVSNNKVMEFVNTFNRIYVSCLVISAILLGVIGIFISNNKTEAATYPINTTFKCTPVVPAGSTLIELAFQPFAVGTPIYTSTGEQSMGADGQITIIPDPNYVGEYNFPYSVKDAAGKITIGSCSNFITPTAVPKCTLTPLKEQYSFYRNDILQQGQSDLKMFQYEDLVLDTKYEGAGPNYVMRYITLQIKNQSATETYYNLTYPMMNLYAVDTKNLNPTLARPVGSLLAANYDPAGNFYEVLTVPGLDPATTMQRFYMAQVADNTKITYPVLNTIPDYTKYLTDVSSVPNNTTLSATDKVPMWTLPNLAPGQSAQIKLAFREEINEGGLNAWFWDDTVIGQKEQCVPKIDLQKTGTLVDTNGNGYSDLGDTIKYNFTVKNTGDLTLTNVKVTDPKITVVGGPIATMLKGAVDTTTFTGTYALTAADITAGKVENTATVTGSDPTGKPVTDISDSNDPTKPGLDDPTIVPLIPKPAGGKVELLKISALVDKDANGYTNIGDQIKYTFTVKNSGPVALTALNITDSKCSPVLGGPLATLAIGASDTTTFSCLYNLTATDIAAGKVDNTATVTGKDPAGNTVSDISDSNDATKPGLDDPTVTLLIPKAIDDFKTTPLNTPVSYNPITENDIVPTGSKITSINGVPVTVGTPIKVTNGTVVLNADGTITVTPDKDYVGDIKFPYEVTTPLGVRVTANDTVTITGSGKIELLKFSSFVDTIANGYAEVGDQIKYTFTVKNSGSLPLTAVTVTDSKCSPIVGGPIATMAVGAVDTTTFSCLYTLTLADINAGKVDNTATVTGKDPTGKAVTDISDSNDPTKPGLDDPTITPLTPKAFDDFKTTPLNTPVTYNPITENDKVPAGSKITAINGTPVVIGTPIKVLNGTVVVNADGTITVTPDLNYVGDIKFPYEVTTPLGVKVTANDTVTVTGTGKIELLKFSSLVDTIANGYSEAGDTIKYTFTVKNTGTLPLTAVKVSDSKCSPVLGGPIQTLAIGAVDTTTFSCLYTLTPVDIAAGKVDNTATVTGNDPSGKPVTDISDSNDPTKPGLDDPTQTPLTPKAFDDIKATPLNTPVTYNPITENDKVPTGSKITAIDGKPVTVGVPIKVLNGTVVVNADGTVTVTPDNNYVGDIKFPYEVTTPTGVKVTANDTVTITGTGKIELLKFSALTDTNANGYSDVGDTIKYTFTVKNVGSLPLTAVKVSDSKCSPVLGGPIATMAIGAVDTITFTCIYPLTAIDIAAGKVDNTATVTGNDPTGKPITDISDSNDPTKPGLDDPTVTPLTPKAFDDVKSTPLDTPITYNPITENDKVPAGSKITAINGIPVVIGVPITVTGGTVTVNADGTVTVKPNPGSTTTITFPYEVTTPLGVKVTANDTVTIVAPKIELLKFSALVDTNANGYSDVGDTIKYTFTVKNTGNTILTAVKVTDSKCTPIVGGPITTIAIGAVDTTTFTCSYALTATDVAAGKVDNTATASGTDPSGKVVTDISDSNDPTKPGQDDPTQTLLTPKAFDDVKSTPLDKPITYNPITENDKVPAGSKITAINDTPVVIGTPIKVTGGSVVVNADGTVTVTPDPGSTTTITFPYEVTTPTGIKVTAIDTITIIAPKIELLKFSALVDTNANGYSDVGDTIKYTFTVKNTGNQVLTGVTVTDSKCSPIVGGPIASMAIGATDTTTFTCSYSLTAIDVAAGKVDNTATASGKDPNGTVVTDISDSNDPTKPGQDDPTQTLLTPKAFDDFKSTPLDTPITYNPITENDKVPAGSKITAINGVPVVIGTPIPVVGGTVTVNADGTVTVKPNPGNTTPIVFPYEVTTPTGIKVTAIDTITIIAPKIELDKAGTLVDTNGDGMSQVGETISYKFTVKNTGNQVLTNVKITDPKVTVSGGPIATLAIGGVDTTTFTATYVLTQADINAGKVDNVATVSGTTPDGSTVTDTSNDPKTVTPDDITSVPVLQAGKIELLKFGTWTDTDGNGYSNVGDVINYTFTVKNVGNVDLTNVIVSDAKVKVTGILPSLLVGASDTTTFKGTYTLTAADIEAGTVVNTAIATGIDPTGKTVQDTSDSNDPTKPGLDDPTIVPLTPKAFDDTKQTPLDTPITYNPITENDVVPTGSKITAINGVPVVIGTPISVVGGTVTVNLDGTVTVTPNPGNTTPIVFPYEVTTPQGTKVTAIDTITIFAPKIELDKAGTLVDTNGDGMSQVGETIKYVFTVKNTGNQILTDVMVTDPKVTVSGTPIATMAIGAVDTTTFTAIYTLTQADIDAGKVDNVATVTGKDPKGNPTIDTSNDPKTTPPNDPTIVPVIQAGKLELIKKSVVVDTNGNSYSDVGDNINYTFTVKNAGNVTLTDIMVTDSKCSPIVGGPIATMAVGAVDSTTFTCTYALTAADVTLGKVENTATVTGKEPSGKVVTDTSDDANDPTKPGQDDPTISLLTPKAFDDVKVTQVNTPITYNPIAENDKVPAGSKITAIDGKPVTIGTPIVVKGGTVTVNADGTVTVTPNPGSIETIIFDYEVTTPTGIKVTAKDTITVEGVGSIELIKSSKLVTINPNGYSDVGDTINYSFTVKNTGPLPLYGVTVNDSKCSPVLGGPIPTFAVGAIDTTTFMCTYTLTAADIELGRVDNTATVNAKDLNGKPVTDISDDGNNPATPGQDDPTKTLLTPKAFDDVKETLFETPITYSPLENDKVPKGSTITGINGTPVVIGTPIKVPNGTVTVNLDGTVTVTPDKGFVGVIKFPYEVTTPEGQKVTAIDTITILKASISLDKEGTFFDANNNGVMNIGELITYKFKVTNTGNMIVKDIKITDPLPGLVISGGPITLGIGEVDSTSFTAKYPVTQADIDAGSVKNQATATGKDPDGKDVTAISNDPKTNEGKDPTIVPLPTIGKIELLKVAQSVDGNGNGYSDIGDYINYYFAVKNVGSVTLTNVTVKDNKAAVVGGPIAKLAPGESDTKTFTAKYMLTDADIMAGRVENSAITNAKDPKGKDVSDISDSNDKSKTGEDDPTITPLVPKPIPPVMPTVRTGAGATYIMLSIASMIAAAFLMMNKKVRRA